VGVGGGVVDAWLPLLPFCAHGATATACATARTAFATASVACTLNTHASQRCICLDLDVRPVCLQVASPAEAGQLQDVGAKHVRVGVGVGVGGLLRPSPPLSLRLRLKTMQTALCSRKSQVKS